MQFLRTNVSSMTNDNGENFLTPLTGDHSDLLPDPLRLYATPCVNCDLDPITQFASAQMNVLLAHFTSISGTSIINFDNNPTNNNPTSCIFYQDFLCNCLFLSTINRFTGAIALLSQYRNTVVLGMQLPTMDDYNNFLIFLQRIDNQKNLPSIFSRQHFNTIPNQLTENRDTLRSFIENLATSEMGFVCIRKRMMTLETSVKCFPYCQIYDWLLDTLQNCGEFSRNDGLKFLAMKIIGDVECFIPEFVLRSLDDPVDLAWGSRNGLECVDIVQLNGKKFQSEDPRPKFLQFHTSLLSFFLRDKIGTDLLGTCGWTVTDGRIISVVNKRPFSYLDTEHILCKIWIAVMNSHSCRNVSTNPRLGSLHCYPLAMPQPWEVGIKPIMENILECFLLIQSRFKDLAEDYRYPEHLLFSSERLLNDISTHLSSE
jgi:hypothetical protein